MTKAVSAPFDCDRCNQRHPRGCTGHKDAPGQPLAPCRNAPIKGATVCRYHGGAAKQVQAEARRRLASAEAVRRLQDVEIVPIGDPLDAYAEVVAWARAWMLQMAQMVNELNSYRFTDDKGAEHLDARVALLERAVDRLQKFLKDGIAMEIEDRKVRVDEVRAGLMAVFVTGVLAALGHDPESPPVLEVIDLWLPVLDGKPAPVLNVEET